MIGNHLNPKVVVKETANKGRGLFAREKILKGEVIENTADIQVLTKEELSSKPKIWRELCYEINDKEEICPKDVNNPPAGFLINHSCEPNCGSGLDFTTTIAMRDIKVGEELTYDYAMTDSGNFEMKCNCGTKSCRGVICGSDWKIPELQEKYQGYFQKNIQDKIDSL